MDKTRMRLRGHVLMATAATMQDAFEFVLSEDFDQFQVTTNEDGEVVLCVPLCQYDRERYTWLYHRMKALDNPEPPKGGPKPPKGPTPPEGGSPAAGVVVAATEVLAIAA